MSRIYATDNLKHGWTVNLDQLASHYSDLHIGFTDTPPVVEFDNLTFGYQLDKDGQPVQERTWPREGVTYRRTDQTWIANERLTIVPDATYSLHLWAVNAGERFEHTVTFVGPRPPQPFASWTWDGDRWQPPVAYPDDGEYRWDEDGQQWVETDEDA